jgi:hypothetical protein
MVQTLPEALERQALACTDLGSPFTAAVLRAFAHLWQAGQVPPALAARLQAFSGDIGPSGHSLPLRLAGALHALHLRGRAGPLTPAYNAPQGWAAADLTAPMAAVLQTEAAFVDHYLDSPPQTNEMRRSGPLIALGQWLTARFGLPLVLSELGASAGLNLIWDRYALDLRGESFGAADPVARLAPDWQGDLPPVAQPRVVARAGADLNPLDPVADRLRRAPAPGWMPWPPIPRWSPAPMPPTGWRRDWPCRTPARCIWSATPSPGNISRLRCRRAARPRWTGRGLRPVPRPRWRISGWRQTAPRPGRHCA